MDALQREVIEDIRGNPGQTASQLWVKYADRLERSETVRILGAAIEKGILTRRMEKIRDGLHGPVMAHRYYPGLDVRELRRLVVTRRAGEAVHFDVEGTSVSIGVVEIHPNKVKLGFLADDRVKIHRMELLNGN